MNYILFAIGAFLVCLVFAEVFITTLAPRGSSSVTEWLRAGTWKIFHWLSGGNGTRKVLNYAGMFTITSWLFVWIFLLWLGNALLYISDPDSVMVSQSEIEASPLEKLYFVGYVLSTMGLGDFEPNGDAWTIYTSFISFTGFIIITIAITYLVPVISAEIGKRKISIFVHSLGTSPDDILLNAWNGEDFSRLEKHFSSITNAIMEQSQNHVAYPVLHNFHSHLRHESVYINLTALDEALTILLLYIPDDIKLHKQDIYPLRYAITDFLATLKNAYIKPSENDPGPIQLDQLRKYGMPLKKESDELKEKLEALTLRRKLLLAMMENDGWTWDSIYMKPEYTNLDLEHTKQIKGKSKKYHEGGEHG